MKRTWVIFSELSTTVSSQGIISEYKSTIEGSANSWSHRLRDMNLLSFKIISSDKLLNKFHIPEGEFLD